MKLTQQQILDIPRRVENSESYKTIAAEYKCGERTIAGWVKKLRDSGTKVDTKRGVKPIKI